jgi:hypothetical protein
VRNCLKIQSDTDILRMALGSTVIHYCKVKESNSLPWLAGAIKYLHSWEGLLLYLQLSV